MQQDLEKLFSEANTHFEAESHLREKISTELKKIDPISRQLQVNYQLIFSPTANVVGM